MCIQRECTQNDEGAIYFIIYRNGVLTLSHGNRTVRNNLFEAFPYTKFSQKYSEGAFILKCNFNFSLLYKILI